MITETIYQIEYDGDQARITPKLPEPATVAMVAALSYEPTGAEWSPTHKRNEWRRGPDGKAQRNHRAHWDGRVSLFKKGRSSYNMFPTGLMGIATRTLNNIATYMVKSTLPYTAPADRTLDGKKVTLKGEEITITLAPHQKQVAEALLEVTRGMAESPTASGKSVIIAEVLYKFPTLEGIVTVPSKSLMHQTAADLSGLLGEKVGVWGDSEYDPARITVAIIDSAYAGLKKQERVEFLRSRQIWIGDESHMSATDRYAEVSAVMVNTQRRYGVSATLRRADGAEMKFHGIFGPTVIKIEPMTLVECGWLVRPRIEMHVIQHNYQHSIAETGKKKPVWAQVYKSEVVFDPARNLKILEQCERMKREKRLPCLILISDLEHGEQLHELISNLGPTAFLQGEDNQKVRNAVIKRLPTLEVEFIVASRIFDVGIDIPQLRSIVLAGAGQDPSRAIQRVGRGLRSDRTKNSKLIPKTEVLIIDFEDRESFFLLNHSMARRWWYGVYYPDCVTSWKDGVELQQFGGQGLPKGFGR